MNAKPPAAPPIRLARPGAGLPWLEALVGRFWIVPRYSNQMSWEASDRFFTVEAGKIMAVYRALPDTQRTTPVLVPRMRGIEDSSRFWSPAMVIEHLLTVNDLMKTVMIELSHARIPSGKADTASVKPLGNQDPQAIIDRFEKFCRDVVPEVNKAIGDPSSTSRFAHPWFGPLTARQWHWLMASHMHIHRKQLEEIGRILSFRGS